MSNVSNDPRNLAEIYNSFLECDGNYHTGKPFQDVYSTIFVIAWVQLVPAMLTILHYTSSIFAKGKHIICCCESWKKAKIVADDRTEIDEMEAPAARYRSKHGIDDEDGVRRGTRSRTKSRMCCIVFARNLLTAINYIIVFAAFVSCLLLIISYLRQQDTDRTSNSDDFALLRASVLVQFILSCLGIIYLLVMPCVMYFAPLPERGISVLIFNARINLQLAIYTSMIAWFVLSFVFTFFGFFYTYGSCGEIVADEV